MSPDERRDAIAQIRALLDTRPDDSGDMVRTETFEVTVNGGAATTLPRQAIVSFIGRMDGLMRQVSTPSYRGEIDFNSSVTIAGITIDATESAAERLLRFAGR